MTKRELRAIKRHSARLDRAAELSTQQFVDLRAAFPKYYTADHGMLSIAATATDNAERFAREFRDRVAALERSM